MRVNGSGNPSPPSSQGSGAQRGISMSKSTDEKICIVCKRKNVKFECGGCGQVRYCDKICRDKHWSEHKELCKKIQKVVSGILKNTGKDLKEEKIHEGIAANGTKYIGTLNEKKLQHGYGIMNFPDGKCYEGQFNNGLIEGQGVLTTPSGDIYDGTFEKGDFVKGKVTVFNPNKTVYECAFKDGEPYGIGTISSFDGKVYRGEIKQWHGNGKGELTLPNNIVISANFVNGNAEGPGTQTNPDGRVLDVMYKNGEVVVNEKLLQSSARNIFIIRE